MLGLDVGKGGSCPPIDCDGSSGYNPLMRTALSFLFRPHLTRLLFVAAFCMAIHAADAPAEFKAGGLSFKRPENFAWVETAGGMRAAQLKVTEEGKTAEVVFFVFPTGVGGGVQANLDRWFGMFQEGKDKINAKTEKVSKSGGEITYAQAEGTYLSGMPGAAKTPQPGSMLQGAIVETESNNIFIRMTGPADLVKKHQKEFRAMVEGAVK